MYHKYKIHLRQISFTVGITTLLTFYYTQSIRGKRQNYSNKANRSELTPLIKNDNETKTKPQRTKKKRRNNKFPQLKEPRKK
jgi:hypothetical protein